MQEKDRLHYKIDQLKQRWHKLFAIISQLEERYDLETRVDEKLRLQSIVEEKQQQRQQVEQELQLLEEQFKRLENNDLIETAQRATKNKAYPQAYELWQEVLNIFPDHQQAGEEISRLQLQLAQQQTAKLLIAQLIERMAEIQPIFAEVVKALNDANVSATTTQLIIEQTESFLSHDLAAEKYNEICHALLSAPAEKSQSTNYPALAKRIHRGDMVLFIGSNLLQEYGQNSSEETQLAKVLAEKAEYPAFTGTLSSIAELYQLLPEYGRRSLLAQLHKAQPCEKTCITLYNSLAKINTPLVLISSAYDNLLEQAFIASGKKYVELSSIIVRSDDYDIGHVVVRYSDNKHPESTYIEEELSRLRLLEEGYSIIYKIRGTSTQNPQAIARDSMTLTESNYFTFARYAKKIIPSYLARQFRDRGFLFMGFSPKNWEDRLLVSTILNKRQDAGSCYTIGKSPDKMEAAYWHSCHVQEYKANLKELDEHLAKAVL